MSTVVFIANLIFQRSPWKLVSQNDTLKMVFLILWWQLVFCTKKVVPWINCSWKRYGSYCPCSSLFRTIAWLCSFFNPFKLREILIMFLVPGWHIFNWSPISCFFFYLTTIVQRFLFLGLSVLSLIPSVTFSAFLYWYIVFLISQAFRICCQDLFFARSRNTPTAQGLVGNVSSANPLEAAFKPARSMTERVNVVGELVNIKVSSPVDADFSIQVS